ncbi:glucosamine-6-phosphate deaminase [Mycolicibacterium aichiense]|uniref:Glucosamine-6-phosphate deaminase n=1 Tax=Mycolicibacterium aichiense TaxID=1799 RepID=A0AAD1HLF1_9MYCO|nr:glucosamine-6-phosphate deaminase [Mycolicibacterium aichiense]MCV7019979.1 glucosamine-6-phosphate deaminase [Mycolicibacterium aichiense]BBX07573.1 glucosamine-6-phosphate deaminase [Mycolicibacterium aichiense]STZ81386.1 glucosamine-6-phosphate isomerase [Mycolicibacterium aichiense]
MNVTVVDDDMFATTAAAALLERLPSAAPTLGVATGGTPMRVYAELASRSRHGELDLSGATVLALDEYVGLDERDPRSYTAYVRSRVADPLGIPVANVHVPQGNGADPAAVAQAFEQRIAETGGVDVQIAGIGSNGHLAFNEPGSPLDSTTRVVDLSDQTRHDNARFFGGRVDDVPRRAITQGLATIGRARCILLLAAGRAKADALAAALRGPVDASVPASVLQQHSDVTVIADRAAWSRMA